MGRISAQYADMLFGVLHIYLGFLFRVLRLLQVFFRQGAMGVKQLRPVEALLRQPFVGGSLLIIGECAG
jgi:hypothetical protein